MNLVILQNDDFAQEVGPKVLFSIKTCLDCLNNVPSIADDLLVGEVLQKCIASLLEAAQFDDRCATFRLVINLLFMSSSESPDDNAQRTQNTLFAVTLIVTMLPVLSFTAGNQETFVEVLLGNLKGSSKQVCSFS